MGILVLVGAGGTKFEHAHIQHTTELVNALPLDEHDLIYLSELTDFPNSTYSQLAADAGIQPMNAAQIEKQLRVLRDAFLFRDAAHAPRVSFYDIREFVY